MKLNDLICSSLNTSKIFSHLSPDFDLDACLEEAFSTDDPFGTLSQTLFDQLPADLQTDDNQENIDLFSEQLLLSVLTPPETTSTDEVTVEETPQEIGNTWDPVTNKRIALLDPRVQGPATAFINKVEKEMGIKLRLTDGFRTFAKQEELYQQSRDGSGRPWVTDAHGGKSYHNYGLAFDVGEIKNNGELNYNIDWKAVSQIAKDTGFEWGGDWTKKDRPHFQMTFGQSISQLLEDYQK